MPYISVYKGVGVEFIFLWEYTHTHITTGHEDLSCVPSFHVIVHVISVFLIISLGHLIILVIELNHTETDLKLFRANEPKLEIHYVHTSS